MVSFTPKQFKTILNKHKLIDAWFWTRYGVNPYNGCQFDCVYCDSRSQKYYLPTDFENNIIVKTNVGEMLDKRLTKARTLLPDVVGLGGTTDAYQPAEKTYKNTRQLLEVLNKHHYPVIISTKSTLILRDIKLLEAIAKDSWATVAFTITTTDQKIARFLEPKAPSPLERFKAIKEIKAQSNRLQVGVLFMPIVPGLCDTEENLTAMVKQSKEAGADFILFSGMTLRDQQALWFLRHLKASFPELLKRYEKIYHFKYNPHHYQGLYAPDEYYSINTDAKMFELCAQYKLPYRIKRFIPQDFRQKNYQLAEKLLNEAYYLQMTGQTWKSLFWVGQNIQNLNESIVAVAKRNELGKIQGMNKKIESYVIEYLK